MTTRLDFGGGTRIDQTVNPDLFGGNMLFDRDRVDGAGTYDDVARNLGLTNVRYPGGTITEWYFDINDPDATVVWAKDRGAERDLLPLSDFLGWAGAEGYGVDLVIPTASLMTGPDGNQVPKGSAYADIKAFVRDVLSGRYGDADIDTFELGNEYWLGAELNHIEYARIADVMARAVQDAIDEYKGSGKAPRGWEEPDIAIQVGQYGKHSTSPGWQQNQYLMNALSDEAAAAIDAVGVHYYTRGGFDDLDSFEYYFDRLDEWPKDPRFRSVEYHMSEWSTENWDTEERGLRQASTMIWMMSEMVHQGIDQAHVWPVQQNTNNDLSGDEGTVSLTLAGEGFRLMSETIPDMTLARRLEFSGGVAYLYQDEDETAVIITSRQSGSQTVTLDARDLGILGDTYWNVILGTSESTNDPDAAPEIEANNALGRAGETVRVDLDGYEIAKLVFGDGGARELKGSAGNDTLTGGDGVERISGLEGDDLISDGDGADIVIAGDGNDTVTGGDGADRVELGDGDDRYTDTPQSGSAGADKIFGGAGNDVLVGGGGNDALSGGDGDDTISGGADHDTLLGLSGNDRIDGGIGSDDIDGGAGDDRINGGDGHDRLLGGAGDDRLLAGTGSDVVLGGVGDDTIEGGGASDVLSGELGRDLIFAGEGADIVAGGDGNDTIVGGAGADTFVFDRDDGTDVIRDFTRDTIDVRSQGLDWSEVSQSRSGADVVVRFAGTEIILEDFGRLLTPDDFLFF